jgi:hypothetical protein
LTNVHLQLRNWFVLLAFLLPGFVFAFGLATPRTAAAADAPFRHELAPTSSAAKQGPTDGMRLVVVRPARPACRAEDGPGRCRARDTLTWDNLTWDSVESVNTVGIESRHATR